MKASTAAATIKRDVTVKVLKEARNTSAEVPMWTPGEYVCVCVCVSVSVCVHVCECVCVCVCVCV